MQTPLLRGQTPPQKADPQRADPPVNRQKHVKTLPSSILRMRSVISDINTQSFLIAKHYFANLFKAPSAIWNVIRSRIGIVSPIWQDVW